MVTRSDIRCARDVPLRLRGCGWLACESDFLPRVRTPPLYFGKYDRLMYLETSKPVM